MNAARLWRQPMSTLMNWLKPKKKLEYQPIELSSVNYYFLYTHTKTMTKFYWNYQWNSWNSMKLVVIGSTFAEENYWKYWIFFLNYQQKFAEIILKQIRQFEMKSIVYKLNRSALNWFVWKTLRFLENSWNSWNFSMHSIFSIWTEKNHVNEQIHFFFIWFLANFAAESYFIFSWKDVIKDRINTF